jgi:poly-gamma-glutamate synthesis protein (capsule biosynthesis protein)
MKKLLSLIPLILSLLTIFIFTQFSEKHYVPTTAQTQTTKDTYSADSESSAQPLSDSSVVETTTPAPTTADSFSITLSFVGDCLCATDEYTSYANSFAEVVEQESPEYFLKKVSKYFKNDDFTIADCENVYSDSTDLTVSDKGQYANPNIEAYWFKTSAKNAKILSSGGIDMVSTSNNHINDYGLQGHTDTQNALDNVGVKWGEEGKIVYYKKNGFKIAVICVSMYSDGVLENIKGYIKKAAKKSNYQIIYFHGGTEAVHTPEDWKVNACHALIDAGADLVIGDHPHVLQPLETYNGKTIIYSMGNFIFGGNRHPENRTIIYQHTLTIGNDNSLKDETGNIIPCYVYTGDMNNWQPAVIKDKSTKKKVLDFMAGKLDSPL